MNTSDDLLKILEAQSKMLEWLEWDEVTGECLLGCGGSAADGHEVGCVYVEKMAELGLITIDKAE